MSRCPYWARKDIEMKNKETSQLKHPYEQRTDCHLTEDGRYIIYRSLTDSSRKPAARLKVGTEGITEDMARMLNDLNHEEALEDRYYKESIAPLFEFYKEHYFALGIGGLAAEVRAPWDRVTKLENSVEDALFAEPEPENPMLDIVRSVIDTCTENQQWLFYGYYGMNRTLTEMRREEIARTGKPISKVAFTNRLNRVLDKVAKALGTTRMKCCRRNR